MKTPKDMPDKSATNVDKTLTKGLLILEALSQSEGPRGISEVATELALTRSNVHRLMQTLLKSGYVAQDERTERYFLSPKLWRIARPQRLYAALRSLIRPQLEALVEETKESATFAVVERDEIVMIDQKETSQIGRVFFSIGQSLPIDEVPLRGKSLTAFQMLALSTWPEDDARRAITKIARQLAKSDSFVEQRMVMLARIRSDGFALSEGDWAPGLNAIAAPVYGRSEKLLGTLVSFGSSDRLSGRTFTKVINLTCAKADQITVSIGSS
ncbi:MAG: IclR family transcriptional regulator [Rhizobiales bacterium]|nr:IclR family transcriptional regulator [Hyphomicrobiales bacterium]